MKIIYLLLAIFFTGCINPPHIREAHRVMEIYTNEMEKDGFSLLESGGSMMDDIKKIHLGYAKSISLNTDQARIILIEKAEKLLSIINNDKKIRPYLNEYPFSLKNIGLNLFFIKNMGEFLESPYIATAYISTPNNKIIYTIDDPVNNRLITVHEEIFEDAMQIYNNHKHNNPSINL